MTNMNKKEILKALPKIESVFIWTVLTEHGGIFIEAKKESFKDALLYIGDVVNIKAAIKDNILYVG